MLVVRVFGGLAVEVDGVDAPPPERRAARTLLAWLALHPGLHSRGDLAARFWPEVLDSSARASLRSALASLRRSLGDGGGRYLLTTRELVGLVGEPEVSVDALRFDGLLREGRLEAALEIWEQGELLQGVQDDWAHATRDDHRERLALLLADHADRAELEGSATQAIELTRRRVALDPLAEAANRDLIRRLGAGGDRSGALGAYGRLADRFRTELGMLPSSETRGLVEELRAGVPAPRGSPGPSEAAARLPFPASVPDPGDHFVSRERELAALDEALGEASTGRPRVALIAGEPGMGKTRLLAEFLARAHGERADVLHGRCQPESEIPYQPFAEALRHYYSTCPSERLPVRLVSLAQELHPLVPGVSERLGLAAPPPVAQREGTRRALFSAVEETLTVASSERPLVLAVDDLHWADAPTVRLLEHLIATTADARLLIVAGFRDTELSTVLARLLLRARRLASVTTIPLEGLDATAIGALVNGRAGHSALPAMVEALHARSSGNPLFAEELVRPVLDRLADGAAVSPEELAAAETGLPMRVTDLIQERLAAISELARRTLVLASVIGEEPSYDLLARLTPGGEEATLDALDEAMRAQLLSELPGAVGRYEFRHALVRETLYTSVSATRRAYLHRRVAEAMEELHGADPEPPLRQLAEHHLRAEGVGSWQEAARYALLAAERATGQLAHEEAADLYRRAGDALKRGGSDERTALCDVLLARGAALRRAGAGSDVRGAYEDAARLARALEDGDRLSRAALGICSVPFFPGREPVDELAAELLQAALERTHGDDDATRARLLAQLARELYMSGESGEVARLVGEAVEAARRSGDAAALGSALDARHLSLLGAGHPQERLALAEEITRLADQGGGEELGLRGRVWRVVDLAELGDLSAMSIDGDAIRERAAALREPAQAWWPALWAAGLALLADRLEEAEALATTAYQVGEEAYGELAAVQLHSQLFWLRWQQGRTRELDVTITPLVERYAGVLPAWSCAKALVDVDLGRDEDAQRALDELASDDFGSLQADASWLATGFLLAEVCRALDDRSTAASLHGLMLPYADRFGVVGYAAVCLGPVSGALASLAGTARLGHQAEQHLEHAAAQYRLSGLEPGQGTLRKAALSAAGAHRP